MRDWEPERALEALQQEAEVHSLVLPDGTTDHVALAHKQVREALPVALSQMIHISSFGETEQMRFQASKYLIDRGLGNVQPGGDLLDTSINPLERILEQITGTKYESEGGAA